MFYSGYMSPLPGKKLFIGLIVVILFIGSFWVILQRMTTKSKQPSSAGKPSKLATNLTPKPQQTTLSINPASKSVAIGEQFPITVVLSHGPVQAADIELRYDPKVLTITDLAPGNILPNYLYKDIQTPGKVTVSVSIDPTKPKELAYDGTVFTVQFKAIKAAASTRVDFDPKNTIAAYQGKNVLGVTKAGVFTIK